MTTEASETTTSAFKGRVPLKIKTFYAVGAAAETIIGTAFNVFNFFFYTNILGVPGTLAGLAITIALVFDAISDPLVGTLSDRWKSKLGRRHPFMLAAPIPVMTCLFLIYSPPEWDSFGLFIWLTVLTVIMRSSMTLFHVPHLALGAELSADFTERTRVMSINTLLGAIGGYGTAFLAYSFVFASTDEFENGLLNGDAYQGFAVWASLIGGAIMVFSTVFTMNLIPKLPKIPTDLPRISVGEFVRDVQSAMTNRNYLMLLIGYLLLSATLGTRGTIDIHMNTYFWEFTPDELRWFALSAIGAICAFIAIPFLQKIIDKHILLQWFLAAVMILAMLKVCFRFWDIWPENGDPLLLQLLICHSVVQTFLLTTCGIMVASLVADLMDEQELETGKRQEGVFSAALSFSAKATTSVGIVIGGLVLDFVVALEKQAPVGSVDDGTLFRLAFSDGIAVPLLFFIPIYLISTITMTRSRLAEVQAQLGEKRALVTVNDSDEGDGAREG